MRSAGPAESTKKRQRKGVQMSAYVDAPFRISARSLPPVQVFRDIIVQPTERPYKKDGPIWHDYDKQLFPRHMVNWNFRDDCPDETDEAYEILEEPAVWIGSCKNNFAHFIGLVMPRLMQSVTERPNDKFLFTQMPKQADQPFPGFLTQILEWFGIGMDQVVVTNRKLMVRELRVAAQAEQLLGTVPPTDYLDALDALARRNDMPDPSVDVVYVARDRLPVQNGHQAGEGYLAECLQSLGATVIRPETLSIRDQMTAYASAHNLIFAEGSAIHGRQMLGRIDQNIGVMVRREGNKIGLSALLPRCNALTYTPAAETSLRPLQRKGRVSDWGSLSLYNLNALFDAFMDVGVDLRAVWDAAAYESHRDSDVMRWIEAWKRRGLQGVCVGPFGAKESLSKGLERIGLDHLAGPDEQTPDEPVRPARGARRQRRA